MPILTKNTPKIELKRYDKKTNFDIILGHKCVDFESYPCLIGKREDQGWLVMTLLSLNNNN